jgi:hypothetical protein
MSPTCLLYMNNSNSTAVGRCSLPANQPHYWLIGGLGGSMDAFSGLL